VTEKPTAGTVEVWEIFNTTADSHPIHIHEVLFRVLNRQPIAFDQKLIAAICNMPLPTFPITLGGTPTAAVGYETGFKDTVLSPPGQVTRVVGDFRNAQSGRFVWHCHILEHEDHEMMRPRTATGPGWSSTRYAGRFPWLELIWADGGYNAWQVDAAVAKVPLLRLEIVKRSDDTKGFVVLPRRWVVERTFSWFGRNRRLAKDFENLAETLAAFVTLASIQLALRRLARA
jgi:transposase